MIDWPELLRWSGALIGLCLLIVCSIIIAKRPLGKQASLSLHFGSNKDTYILMGLFLTFAGAIFYSFIWFWLIPTYNLSVITYPVLVVSYIAQLFMSWWPASKTDRRSHTIHLIGGITVAASMVIILGLLSLNFHQLPMLSGVYILIGTITTVLCLIIYALDKQLHKYFLIFESVFIAFFCTALIGLTLKI